MGFLAGTAAEGGTAGLWAARSLAEIEEVFPLAESCKDAMRTLVHEHLKFPAVRARLMLNSDRFAGFSFEALDGKAVSSSSFNMDEAETKVLGLVKQAAHLLTDKKEQPLSQPLSTNLMLRQEMPAWLASVLSRRYELVCGGDPRKGFKELLNMSHDELRKCTFPELLRANIPSMARPETDSGENDLTEVLIRFLVRTVGKMIEDGCPCKHRKSKSS